MRNTTTINRKTPAKKILIITSGMPPSIGRVEKMIKYAVYLEKRNWRTYFLVPGGYFTMQDPDLTRSIPPSTVVYETTYILQKLYNPFQYRKNINRTEISFSRSIMWKIINTIKKKFAFILFLDKSLLWFPIALAHGYTKHKTEKFDLILTNNNPPVPHIIGLILKKLCQVPWIAEFRDPWYANSLSNHRMSVWDYLLESLVVNHADRIIHYKGYQLDTGYFLKRYPQVAPDRFYLFPDHGGFDPSDFKDRRISVRDKKTMMIAHTGTLYGNSADTFFRALKNFIAEKKSVRVSLLLDGSVDSSYSGFLNDPLLSKIITINGMVSHGQAIADQMNADLLLLVIGNGENQNLCTPSKLWEYIGSGTYILGIVPRDSESAKIIIENSLGLVADPDDYEAIYTLLEKISAQFRRGRLQPRPGKKFLATLNREKNFQLIIDLFDSVLV